METMEEVTKEGNPLLPHLRVAWEMLDVMTRFITSVGTIDCYMADGDEVGRVVKFEEARAAAREAMEKETGGA